jgi:hypothetical protein
MSVRAEYLPPLPRLCPFQYSPSLSEIRCQCQRTLLMVPGSGGSPGGPHHPRPMTEWGSLPSVPSGSSVVGRRTKCCYD